MASEIISWAVTAWITALVLSFFLFLAGLRRLPKDRRPKVRRYDRFGAPIKADENPGPEITGS